MPEPTNDALVKTARDLREIDNLAYTLADQATHKPNAHLMPGGQAQAELATVANLEAWENLIEHAESQWAANRRHRPDITHENDDDMPALQLLTYWTEHLRRTTNTPTDLKATLWSETAYLRRHLENTYANEPRWTELAADIRKARTRLEGVLYAGTRPERTRVPCIQCDTQPRLNREYGPTAADDCYRCPRCRHRYDHAAYMRAKAHHLASEGAARFVKLQDAIAALEHRPERTVRQWVRDGHVTAYCDRLTHQLMVWWPTIRELDLDTPRRKRHAA